MTGYRRESYHEALSARQPQGFSMGTALQSAGIGINFGSALGTLIEGNKTKQAVRMTMAAGRADAAAMLLQGEEQARQHTQNAYLANFDATLVAEQAKDEAVRIRRQGRRLQGEQLATAAAQGAMIDASVMDVYEEQLHDIERVAFETIYAGELQKKSLRQQSHDFVISADAVRKTASSEADKILAQASLDAYKLKLQRQQQVIGAIGTIAQSVGQGFALFNSMRTIGQTTQTSTTTYSSQYSSPIGPPAPQPTAPLIEPQEYLDYQR